MGKRNNSEMVSHLQRIPVCFVLLHVTSYLVFSFVVTRMTHHVPCWAKHSLLKRQVEIATTTTER